MFAVTFKEKLLAIERRATSLYAEDQTQERSGVGRMSFLDSASFLLNFARLRIDQKYRERIFSHKIYYGI